MISSSNFGKCLFGAACEGLGKGWPPGSVRLRRCSPICPERLRGFAQFGRQPLGNCLHYLLTFRTFRGQNGSYDCLCSLQ
jgi:hypothetical protein